MIKYVPEGDKFKASQLWGEGRHQLSILKNAMSFRGLQQDQREVSLANGTSIKCKSCFGQDAITIFVPTGGDKGGKRRRKRVEIQYLPAIEVYDGPSLRTFMGVVLCKGGGFEPPYEFIAKDYLPTDYWYEQPLRHYKERHWQDHSGARSDEPRKFQDIIPKGIHNITSRRDNFNHENSSGGYEETLSRVERRIVTTDFCPFDHWRYEAEACPRFVYDTVVVTKFVDTLTIYGDSPGTPIVTSSDFDFNQTLTIHYDALNSGLHLYFVNRSAVKPVKVGEIMGVSIYECQLDDENINFSSIQEAVEALITQELIDSIIAKYNDGSYPRRLGECGERKSEGHSHYTKIWNSMDKLLGTAADVNHYAVVYSLNTSEGAGEKHSITKGMGDCLLESYPYYPYPSDCVYPYYVENNTGAPFYGPLNIMVSDVTFEIFPRAPKAVSPRLRYSYIKYFRLREETPQEKEIGMFFIGKNYYRPYDYMYIYADIVNGEKRMIKTPVDGKIHKIPGIKGMKDGVAVDLYGKGTFRLIRDERTIIMDE